MKAETEVERNSDRGSQREGLKDRGRPGVGEVMKESKSR